MNVTEFRRVFASLPQGWLDLEEALLLVDAAERTEGPMLEVGSYYGRSACLLGRLCRHTWEGDEEERPLTCVDPWADRGDFRYGPGVTGDEVFAAFKANVAALPNVRAVRGCIEDVTLRDGYGFAYLDGDHSYVGTLAQVRAAMLSGAKVIAAHDVNDGGGGVLVKRACLELLGPWQERAGRLAVWEIRK